MSGRVLGLGGVVVLLLAASFFWLGGERGLPGIESSAEEDEKLSDRGVKPLLRGEAVDRGAPAVAHSAMADLRRSLVGGEEGLDLEKEGPWGEAEVLEKTEILWGGSPLRSLRDEGPAAASPAVPPYLGVRLRLVRDEGLGRLVRVVDEFERESLKGEPRLLRSIGMVADRVLVKVADELEEVFVEDVLSLAGAVGFEEMGDSGVYLVELGEADLDTMSEALAVFKGSALEGFVEYAEPDYVVHASDFSDDPFLTEGRLWGLHNEGAEGGMEDVDIDAIEGWDIETDAGEVVVAVIDTGVLHSHEDLLGNVWVNTGEIAGNGVDDDGNGYVDDVHGINAVTGSGDPLDDHGHGTHVAGTIGAKGNNGLGMTGVAWEVQLMPLKFLSASGSGLVSDAIECLDYAVAHGAKITNNSWGGGGYSQAFQDALDRAEEAGVLFVAAAGNEGKDIDEEPQYPASYANENVISVGSIDRDGGVSSFSNYGIHNVDVFAPGRAIWSTWFEEETLYRAISGTSMATPHVSGILALQGSRFPEDSFLLQKERLMATSVPDESYQSFSRSGGLANLANALVADDLPPIPSIVSRPRRIEYAIEGEPLSISVEVESASPVMYRWYYEGELLEDLNGASLGFESARTFYSGSYRVEIENEAGVRSTVFELRVLASREVLSEAADNADFDLYSRGDGDWVVYPFDGFEGGTSVRSEAVRDGRRATLFADVRGPGILEFAWRVSSEENSDIGSVRIDGEELASIDGETNWREFSVELDEDRSYRVEWRYEKDANRVEGDDSLYLDSIRFTDGANAKPRIVGHPEDYVAGPDGEARFSVSAKGEALAYQWFKDGAPVPGAVGETLMLQEVSEMDAGLYWVEVVNGNGSSLSLSARLEVGLVPVEILEEPRGGIYRLGDTAELSVFARGTGPLAYQWFVNGLELEGADERALRLADLQEIDGGEYWVLVSSPIASEGVKSESVEIEIERIQISPRFVKEPEGAVALIDGEVSLHAVAEGLKPIDYQWYHEGRILEGETASSLSLVNIDEGTAGRYTVTAENAYGRARSEKAALTVVEGVPEAFGQVGWEWELEGEVYMIPQNTVTRDGVSALESRTLSRRLGDGKLTTELEGPGYLSFDWRQDYFYGFYRRVALWVDGVKRREIDTRSGEWEKVVIELEQGTHEVEWRFLLDRFDTSAFYLDRVDFTIAPVVLDEPEPQLAELGGQAHFEVNAEGGELSYQWIHNGKTLEGETGSSLLIEEITYQNFGEYVVRVSNEGGTVDSEAVLLNRVENIDTIGTLSPLELETGGVGQWKPIQLENGEWALGVRDIEVGISWVETVVEGPSLLRWRQANWGACSLGFDTRLDGTVVRGEKGSSEDPSVKVLRIPEGAHTLRWEMETFCFNFFGDGFGNGALWDIERVGVPVVVSQPQAQKRIEGEVALFACDGIGVGALSFQWYREGMPLEGENENELWLIGLDESDEGGYACLITDQEGRRSWTREAVLEVHPDLVDALDRIGLRDAEYENQRLWSFSEDEGLLGGDALVFEVSGSEHWEGFEFVFRKAAFDQGSTQRVWLKGLLADGDKVRLFKGNDILYEAVATMDWQPVFLDTEEWGDHSFRLEIERLGGSPEPTRVILDRFELYQAPDLGIISRSPERWGRAVDLEADFAASGAVEIEWSREGTPLNEGVSRSNRQTRLRVEAFSPLDEGLYTLTIRNALGVTQQETYLQDSSRFGLAMDAPNAPIATAGPFRWEEDVLEKKLGDRSLRGDLGEKSGDAFLQFELPAGRECSFWIRSSLRSGEDPIRISLDGVLEFEIGGETGWTKYELVNGSESETVEVRIDLQWAAANEGAGSFWIDGLRIRKSSSFNYAVWEFEAFDFEQRRSPLISGPNADPDGDGLVNRMEYAFDRDPFSPDPLPDFEMIDFGGGWYSLIFDQPSLRERPDIEYWIEKSWDFDVWTIDPEGVEYKRETDSGWRTRLTDFVDGSELEKEFNRLNVIYVPED